jgi:hypothetical protein
MLVPSFTREQSRTIFQEEWWLKTVCGDALERVSVTENGRDVAHLYFTSKRYMGCTFLRMPLYTRTLGPVFEGDGDKIPKVHKRDIYQRLIAALPPHDFFNQVFEPDDESALIFALHGFDVGASYTVKIPADLDSEVLWRRMDARRRKRIRDRQKDLEVERHSDIARFIRLAQQEYSASINYHQFSLLERLFAEASERGRSCILSATRNGTQDASAAVLIWDAQTMYFWLAARDHGAGRGAKTLVLWDAIKMAHQMGLSFDFDGFYSLSGANFILSFGLPTSIRPIVSHANLKSRFALAGRNVTRYLKSRARQQSRLVPV